MHYVRQLTGSTLEEQLFPASRTINFSDETAVITVSTLLRHTWASIPPSPQPDQTSLEINTFMKEASYLTPEERANTPKNPDLTIHTEWRDLVYRGWNHVFYDVMNFLGEAAAGVGHFKPPSHDALPVYYTRVENERALNEEIKQQEIGKAWEGEWSTHVLLIPTYLPKGLKVKILKKDSEELFAEFERGESEVMTEILWLKKGTEVSVVLEKEGGNMTAGDLAVVFAVGVLCDCENDDEVRKC